MKPNAHNIEVKSEILNLVIQQAQSGSEPALEALVDDFITNRKFRAKIADYSCHTEIEMHLKNILLGVDLELLHDVMVRADALEISSSQDLITFSDQLFLFANYKSVELFLSLKDLKTGEILANKTEVWDAFLVEDHNPDVERALSHKLLNLVKVFQEKELAFSQNLALVRAFFGGASSLEWLFPSEENGAVWAHALSTAARSYKINELEDLYDAACHIGEKHMFEKALANQLAQDECFFMSKVSSKIDKKSTSAYGDGMEMNQYGDLIDFSKSTYNKDENVDGLFMCLKIRRFFDQLELPVAESRGWLGEWVDAALHGSEGAKQAVWELRKHLEPRMECSFSKMVLNSHEEEMMLQEQCIHMNDFTPKKRTNKFL